MSRRHYSTVSATLLLLAAGVPLLSAEDVVQNAPDQLTVVAPRDGDGYAPPETASSARSDTPLSVTPSQVQIVPQQVIEDQSAYTLKKVLSNVSGVAPDKNEGYALVFESAIIRGFMNNTIYMDGFPARSHGVIPLQVADHVEIAKGPASMLYGQISPGGLINVVSKKPMMEPQTSVHGSYDSHGAWSAWGDTTGVVSRSGELSYRLVAGYEDLTTFRDGSDGYRTFAAPSLAWRPSDRSELVVYATYTKQEQSIDDGVAFTYTGDAVVPITQNNNTPAGLPGKQIQDLQAGYQYRYDINDALSFVSASQYGRFINLIYGVRCTSATSATDTITRQLNGNHFHDDYYQTQNELRARYDTGPVRHKSRVGADYSYTTQLSELKSISLGAQSIYDPVDTLPTTLNWANISSSKTINKQFGGFAQDEASFGSRDEWHVLAGVRVDQFQSRTQKLSPTTSIKDLDQQALTWRVGAMYEVVKEIGPYASYSTSFEPSSASSLTYDGQPLDPVTAYQYEAGVKASFADNRLSLTACWFQLTQENVAVLDPVHTTQNYYVNGGTYRSQGIEADVVGRVIDGLEVIGSLTHMSTELIETSIRSAVSTKITEGTPKRNAPDDMGSLWAKYTLQSGPVRGLGIGLGMQASSDKPGDDTNSFKLPGYAIANGGLFYTAHIASTTAKTQLNFVNIFDRTYYESSYNTGRVMPGQPFTVVGSVTLEF